MQFTTNNKILIAFIAFIAVVIGGGVLWNAAWQPAEVKPDEEQSVAETQKEGAVVNEEAEFDTSDWQTYRNEEWGFEFKYPKEWEVVRENDFTYFYGPDWVQEEDVFKKELIRPLMSITFKNDVPSIENWLLQELGEGRYETLDALVQGEIDVYEYANVRIDDIVVPVLVFGAETVAYEYYIPLKKQNNYAFIRMVLGQNKEIGTVMLSTIKTN